MDHPNEKLVAAGVGKCLPGRVLSRMALANQALHGRSFLATGPGRYWRASSGHYAENTTQSVNF